MRLDEEYSLYCLPHGSSERVAEGFTEAARGNENSLLITVPGQELVLGDADAQAFALRDLVSVEFDEARSAKGFYAVDLERRQATFIPSRKPRFVTARTVEDLINLSEHDYCRVALPFKEVQRLKSSTTLQERTREALLRSMKDADPELDPGRFDLQSDKTFQSGTGYACLSRLVRQEGEFAPAVNGSSSHHDHGHRDCGDKRDLLSHCYHDSQSSSHSSWSLFDDGDWDSSSD